jgi:hypothetical protein
VRRRCTTGAPTTRARCWRHLETYDLEVIEPPIPKTIKFAEAPAAGRSILATSRSSKGAKAYREAATHLSSAPSGRGKRKVRDDVSRHRGTRLRPRYARMGAAARRSRSP